MRPLLCIVSSALVVLTKLCGAQATSVDEGVLFYLSGDKGTRADYSAGDTPDPTFDEEVSRVADGARGVALRCGNLQRLAWRAPGNVFAQRGTLSFFWRSREPVGPTEFPLFRIAYADHSSWDMVWLRIDYNGHGFDAFVTDTSLARLRVSTRLASFPKPDSWIHLAFSWDETKGVRLYINGQPAAALDQTALLDAGLDQFGPHSRIISPHNVQSDYNFVRGGDLDELYIHDRMLDDAQIAALARGERPGVESRSLARSLSEPRWAQAWARRHGWEKETPPALPAAETRVRVVAIPDARDHKRWYWKACDGIPETTWPGVYNRSRLPGRNDYFQLPDWDCYVESGRELVLTPGDEPWNQIEFTGAAFGRITLPGGATIEREEGRGRSSHRLPREERGGRIHFLNTEQETPIAEFALLNVTPGRAPEGSTSLAYRLSAPSGASDPSLPVLQTFIRDRFPPGERSLLVAVPSDNLQALAQERDEEGGLPVVHVLIPNGASTTAHALDKVKGGLDGIELSLPALAGYGSGETPIPLNLQIKDPLWPQRNLLDFSFAVKPGQPCRLWLDLRDRLLPPGRALYLCLASGAGGISAQSLSAADVRLVFKPTEQAKSEHEADRFAQVRDAYAFLVEEHPHDPRYALWNRFEGDLRDLMRVNPQHVPGRNYFAVGVEGRQLDFPLSQQPEGVPLWAFRQAELVRRVQSFAEWMIDNRQSPYGDFGGGISDDTDLLNLWPGIALMGCKPEKLRDSLERLLEAAYRNGMFTNGLSTIQTDELHSYEEGINCLGANLILSPGSPLQLERAMETTRALIGITGVNNAGHRHIRSSYYSGTRLAEEGVWGWAKAYSYLAMQPAQLLGDYNGNPLARQMLTELADGLLAHRKKPAKGPYRIPSAIEFSSDREASATRGYLPWPLFWNAWQWTGKAHYLAPILDQGVGGLLSVNPNALDILELRQEWGPRILAGEEPSSLEKRPERRDRGTARSNSYRASSQGHFAWQLNGDTGQLERLYTRLIQECLLMEYISTEGSLWTDRIGVPTTDLQRERLGGIALARNSPFPGHLISWRFPEPAGADSVAILIPEGTPRALRIIAYNLEQASVSAQLGAPGLEPGEWELTQGVDTDGNGEPDKDVHTRSLSFGRGRETALVLPPRATSLFILRLKTPGKPYADRPDLGLESRDLHLEGRMLSVRVHSLGSVPAPAAQLTVLDAEGHTLAETQVPALDAPSDLKPRSFKLTVELPLPPSGKLLRVLLDPADTLEEITRANNQAILKLPESPTS